MVERTVESYLEQLEYNYTFIGQERIPIDNVAPIDKGTSSHLSFCSSDKHADIEAILNSNSGIILCKKSIVDVIRQKNKFISNNSSLPKLCICR